MEEVEKAMYQLVEWHFQIIFSLLTCSKCDLGEVDKLPIHFDLIFCLINSPKCDLDEILKAMFEELSRFGELTICLLTTPKDDLHFVEKAMF